ncbi:hypothetical protein Tco_1236983 [Tanacetum coccineum]
MDSILEDSVDEGNLADPNNDLVDTIPEMFTDEHTLDYSSPPLYDDMDLLNSIFEYEDFYEIHLTPRKIQSKTTIRVTNCAKNVKKLSSSNASLILEDFNPPLYELPFHKEVPGSETLLPFSS